MLIRYLALVGLVLIALLVSSCFSNSAYSDRAEDHFRWSLFISPGDTDTEYGWYDLTLMRVGQSGDYTPPQSIAVDIDGTTYDLEDWGGIWFGGAELTPGAIYTVTLIVDGNVQAYADLPIVHNASVRFPQIFYPRESSSISWAQNGNNQTQIVLLTAQNTLSDRYDEYAQAISSSGRNWTFPRRAVKDLGWEAVYTIEVIQMNRIISGDVLMQSIQTEMRVFGED